jgi:hypothetical protein
VLARLLAAAYPGNASVTMLQAVLLAKAGKVWCVRGMRLGVTRLRVVACACDVCGS